MNYIVPALVLCPLILRVLLDAFQRLNMQQFSG